MFELIKRVFGSSQRPKPGRRRGATCRVGRSWNRLDRTISIEALEARAVPSATPIAATGLPVSGLEGFALNNVPVANFTAGDGSQPPGNFLGVINWGDGTTTNGTVSESGATYTVSGTHTYTFDRNYTIIVGIQDGSDPATFVNSQATIAAILPDGTQGTPTQRFVHEELIDLLQRPVSMDEINYWVGQYEKNHEDRQTLVQMIIEFTPPFEYRRDEIDSAYQTYLHRPADQQGEDYFLTQVGLSKGVRSGPGTEKRTSALLINSDEYYFKRAGGTVDGFITAVFEDALKRPPSASDLAYFGYALTHGLSHIEFATTVLNSQEFSIRSINSLYERYLGRPADPVGLQNFLFNIATGYGTESNTETLLDTDEFYNRAVGNPLS
ncbi:MAG TPA: hypothetical protein VF306_04380 [Pirellulales bacterium]